MSRRTLGRVCAIALASAALVLSACSDGTDSNASKQKGDKGSSSASAAEAAAAAQKRLDAYLSVPEEIAITEPLSAAPKQGVSVYWVTPNLQSQQPNTDAFEAATEALGWKLTTLQTESSDPQAVPSAIRQAVDAKADYIVVSGGSVDTYGAALDAAKAAGIPILSMYSTDQVGDAENGVWANIGGTPWIEAQHRATVDFLIADSGGTANVLYVDMPDFPILAAAAEATRDQFESECPDCTFTKLDVTVDDLLSGSIASQAVSSLQRNSDITYVFTASGDLATGLPEALDQAGFADRVQIVTTSPNDEQMQALVDGRLLAVVPNPKAQGSWTAIDAMTRMEDGLEIGEDHGMMPIVVWTADNVPQPLEAFEGAEDFEAQFLKLWNID